MTESKESIFITARLKSTRLKKKVLLEVNDLPIISYLIKRIQENTHKQIIICTSKNPEDLPLIEVCKAHNINYFMGAEEDVIDRYYQASKQYNVDKLYIIYGDEPCIDIDTMNSTFKQLDPEKKLYIKNCSLPEGTFGYGLTFKALKLIQEKKVSTNNEAWGKMAEKLDITTINNPVHNSTLFKKVRVTIDYQDDFIVFQNIIKALGSSFFKASLQEIVDVYTNLNLYKINGHLIDAYNKRIAMQAAK